MYTGLEAGKKLLENQLKGIEMVLEKKMICKINIVTLLGINDEHISDIVRKVKDMGCFITNIMPFIPVQGSTFENLPVASLEKVMKLRKMNEEILPQMYHCKQCRADAIGTLECQNKREFA
jgi:MoaA/NifB/PqqE/SkfB family radical SAM enzyme